jgi:hypothetical protein
MNFLRLHWFDLGIVLAAVVGMFVLIAHSTGLALLLWISLASLFLHQFEEYRYPGYFPGMMNTVMYSSDHPDRYPLNTNTALIVNLVVGWLFYFLAALFGEKALWLGIATILVSAGNFIAHTLLFNVKRKSRYNPGMLTADLLFLPIAVYFFFLVIHGQLAVPLDWGLGIILGIVLNYLGILKMIDLLKNKNTRYIFPQRFLLPGKNKNGN